jgi:hypothetical protein
MSASYAIRSYAADFTQPAGQKTLEPYVAWDPSFASIIKSEKCSAVSLGAAFGTEDSTQLALQQSIEYLTVNSYPASDASPFQEMHWLKGLSIGAAKLSAPFNFLKLVSLEALSVTWQDNKMTGLFEHTGLRKLLIDNYPYVDLSPLAGMTGLERLEVRSRRNLRSVAGLERLPRLRQFGVVFGPHLTIQRDDRLPPSIEKVDFYSCKSLSRIDPLGRLPWLKDVRLDKCGHIESLAPLRQCRELTDLLCFDTISDDGDMAFLAQMPKLIDLRMQWRKHFRPEKEVITAAVMRNREVCPNLPDYLKPPPQEWRPRQPR